jgi:1,2-diacylglycerol 3-alpha-glucosyltransferase
MKILVCASEYYPYGSGIANVAYNLVERLKKQGIDCTVCSPTGPDIVLGSFNLIQKTGIIGLLYFWNCIAFFLKKSDYDIIWLHNPLLIFKIPLGNVFCTYHSTYFGISSKMHNESFLKQGYYKIGSIIEKYCLNTMSNAQFIGVSSQVCNELNKICPNKQSSILILNGVDNARFSPLNEDTKEIRENLNVKNNPIILYVGRLDTTKFVDSVILALPLIVKKVPTIKLLLVGDGPQKEDLMILTKKLGISDSVIFCGLQPNCVLPGYYHAADIVVCPYSGLVLFEAMASGKAIVAYNLEWHSEIITNMQNGILVEDLNQIDLANAVVSLLTDTTLAKGIGENAREFALKNLDWSKISDKYRSIFTEVIAK